MTLGPCLFAVILYCHEFFLVALYGYDQCIELWFVERIEAKEISEGTVCNYVKAIKAFL